MLYIYLFKILLTAGSIWCYNIVTSILNATIAVSTSSAISQFNDSDVDYVTTIATFAKNDQLTHSWLPLLILFITLGTIWYKEIVRVLLYLKRENIIAFMAVCILGSALHTNDANAYYSSQDWAEWYNVLPNHSAFLIPAVGASKDKQQQFESETFLNEKKVGAKRIQIEHVVLKNSGVVDAYVPKEIMVLLDRTPYVVRWTKAQTQESPVNQEMCVESEDSIEVCFDVSIGANVTEEDAARYLYWFGTEPATQGNENERNFPSLLNGKSLPNVMNTRVHSRIQAAYFVEFSKYPFTQMLAKKGDILKAVEAQMITEYKKMGITIEYVGIASQFRFDPKLQNAITNLVTTQYDRDASVARLESAKTDRYIAETQNLTAQGDILRRWDGHSFPNVPSIMVSSDSVLEWVKSLFNTVKNTGSPAATTAK